jgi:hypothetical protein
MDNAQVAPVPGKRKDDTGSWTLDPERPVDPFGGWRTWQLAALARKAERAGRRGHPAVTQLAVRKGVPARQLWLLGAAWAAGRRAGIAALGPAPAEADGLTMLHARVAVETWALRSYPGRPAHADIWRNRVTVWLRERRRPGGDLPLAHLRLAPDGTWHLYRRGVDEDWWPVAPDERQDRSDVYTFLAQVHRDQTGEFRPGPSRADRT